MDARPESVALGMGRIELSEWVLRVFYAREQTRPAPDEDDRPMVGPRHMVLKVPTAFAVAQFVERVGRKSQWHVVPTVDRKFPRMIMIFCDLDGILKGARAPPPEAPASTDATLAAVAERLAS